MKSERKIWINKTKQELCEKRTDCERIVFSHFSKYLRKYSDLQRCFRCGQSVYFTDIYIKKAKIVVEVDGSYHFTEEQQSKDKIREDNIRQYCLWFFRISNTQVLDGLYLDRFCKALDIIAKFKIKPIGCYGAKHRTMKESYFYNIVNSDVDILKAFKDYY